MIAAAVGLLLLLAEPAVPKDYFEINSTYARACAQGAVAARDGQPAAEAITQCNKALDTEPLNALGVAQTLINRGLIRFAGHDGNGALADFNAAVKSKPDFAPAYINRAAVHLSANRYDAALSDAERAVQLDNTNARAWLMRGGANEMLGKTVQAYKDYQTAARLDPTWEQPKTELARFRVVK